MDMVVVMSGDAYRTSSTVEQDEMWCPKSRVKKPPRRVQGTDRMK